ncbi:membrane-associated protein, putative [Bodo saltans]|uniref:Membrane-associated protein, putative n=1 Tax=Bodo saltans TaxID=75058 RepID=A0A0S4JSK8_BODSA|nr:membrane-associated protein, putative [Bodo saltans]|eukprot:CUG91525.1 membrane-associated protein, putative [Bodo saltans]
MDSLALRLGVSSNTTVALGIVATIAAAAAAAVLARNCERLLYPDCEDPKILETSPKVRSEFLRRDNGASKKRAQEGYDETSKQYNFQRRITGSPLRNMDLPRQLTLPQRATQSKEFLWIAGSNADWHIGLALLQFQFIGVLVVNIWDVKQNVSWSRKVEVPLAALLGAGPHFRPGSNGHRAPGSDGHEVTFGDHRLNGGCRASVRFTANSDGQLGAFVHFSGNVHASPNSACGEGQQRIRRHGRRYVEFDYAVKVPTDHLSMVFPIGPHRASMVVKFAGASTAPAPRIRWDKEGEWMSLNASDDPTTTTTQRQQQQQQQQQQQLFLVALDYTRGLLRRETTWYWACVNCVAYRRKPFDTTNSTSHQRHPPPRADNVHQLCLHVPEENHHYLLDSTPVRFGFHLSSGTYDEDRSGISFESTVYIDGRVVLFQIPVKFTHDSGNKVSTSTLRSTWKIAHDASSTRLHGAHTTGGDLHENPNVATDPSSPGSPTDYQHRLQLTFTPVDGHLGHFNYVAIRGALLHYWGTFSGSVWVEGEEYVIHDAPGVIEDHYALW